MSTTVSYKGATIATVSNDTKTLLTEGKYLEDDLTLVDVSGGGAVLTTKNISANGTYNASSDSADGYSQVTVAVPNSYSAGDEGKVVSNGALVAQTSDTVTENDTYDTTLINSLTVNVSGGSGSKISIPLKDFQWEVGAVSGTPGHNYSYNKTNNTARLRGANLFQTYNLPFTLKANWGNGEWIIQYSTYDSDGICTSAFTACTQDTELPASPYLAIVCRHTDGTTTMNSTDIQTIQPVLELDYEVIGIVLGGT